MGEFRVNCVQFLKKGFPPQYSRSASKSRLYSSSRDDGENVLSEPDNILPSGER